MGLVDVPHRSRVEISGRRLRPRDDAGDVGIYAGSRGTPLGTLTLALRSLGLLLALLVLAIAFLLALVDAGIRQGAPIGSGTLRGRDLVAMHAASPVPEPTRTLTPCAQIAVVNPCAGRDALA